MEKIVKIGLVGDFDKRIDSLVKLNEAVEDCIPHLNFSFQATWIPTASIDNNFLSQHSFNGFWVVPGSPYKNDEGVYDLIKWSRENNFPLLGSCGGFQYMVVEYARNVLGFSKAAHQESNPNEEQLIISKLTCSLKGQQEEVIITDKPSWLHQVINKETITGHYYCSYGVNPVYQSLLNQYPLVFTAFSQAGEARALELKTHRFFNGSLFQPSLDSHREQPNPLLLSFFNKCGLP